MSIADILSPTAAGFCFVLHTYISKKNDYMIVINSSTNSFPYPLVCRLPQHQKDFPYTRILLNVRS